MASNLADMSPISRSQSFSGAFPQFRRRAPLAVIVLISALVLGTALLAQFWGGLAPCELCLYERWPYDGALLVGIAGLLARTSVRRLSLLAIGVGFTASAILAFYHVGVEQHWFAGPSACTGGGGADTVEAMTAQILGTQVVMCDQPAWTFHGLSLAAFNLLASLLLLSLSLAGVADTRTQAADTP